MRRIFALAILSAFAMFLGGCGQALEVNSNTKNANTASGNSNTGTANTENTNRTSTTTTTTSSSTGTTKEGEAPVELIFLGISPDKEQVNYKIKVNTDKPIAQIDLDAKYMDDRGKVILETVVAWQNVVRSKRQPIEKGRIYEANGFVEPGATRAEYTLKRVVFQDGTSWSAR